VTSDQSNQSLRTSRGLFRTGSDCPLVGRQRELAFLHARLEVLREHGVALLIRGERGIGVSALLAGAVDHAQRAGMQVLNASGTRAEVHLAYAGLHQLLRPLLGRSDELPRPRRDALLGAFGIDGAPAPDPFLVGLATLELLVLGAARSPLLVAVDDAHVLDSSTVETLGFVARRLGPEPIALFISLPDRCDTPLTDCGLVELRVGPLDEPSSRHLLERRAPDLGPELRRRVLADAGGNPLALAELPASAGVRVPGQHSLPERLHLTNRLAKAMLEPCHDLPPATRTLLLVAAVDGDATIGEVLVTARLVDDNPAISRDDLCPAVESRLIECGEHRLAFRHPLLAAAIHQCASPALRTRVHAAMAATLADGSSRGVWHRAAATNDPDEHVAAELEGVSLTAMAQGALTLALATIERAADLTPDPFTRDQRLIAAAELSLGLGRIDQALRLLEELDHRGNVDRGECVGQDVRRILARTRISLVRQMVDSDSSASCHTVPSLVDAAQHARSAGEIDLALRLLRAAAMKCWWAGPAPDLRDRIIGAAEHILEPDTALRVLSTLAMIDPAGYATALREIARRTAPDLLDPETAASLGSALCTTGAFEQASIFLSSAVNTSRGEGRLWLLPEALVHQAWAAIHTGHWATGIAAATEAQDLAEGTRQPRWAAAAMAARSTIAVIRGDDSLAETLLGQAESIALPLGANAALCDVELARGLLTLGCGRYEEAFEHLRRTFDPHDPAYHPFRSYWRIGEFAEAAVRAGRAAEGRARLIAAEGLAALSLSPCLQLGMLYARPLLAADETTEAQFQAALGVDLSGSPFHRARLLLEYGSWLRRQRRISHARTPLRAARDAFLALGATPWAERARQELRAARESRHHQPEAWTQLTEQERQIAGLAASGLTNREIAERLYISHRTVGSHLYRIFPKLEVASRAQLQALIGSREPTSVAS
jgi:DNA-binding CsgD family transcriptional regulator